MMDEALLRPGRLEVQIEIGLPNEKGRSQILKVMMMIMMMIMMIMTSSSQVPGSASTSPVPRPSSHAHSSRRASVTSCIYRCYFTLTLRSVVTK